jgi:phenylacetate-CoA ligase
MMDIARMILSELTLRQLPKIPSFSAHLGKIYWEAYKACRRQWDAEELERFQTKRLRAIIKHAYEHVEYYHEQFDSLGIKTEDIKTKKDLCKLPTLSKQDLRTHFPDLIATNYNLGRCTTNKTSGSTGEPTTILTDEYRNLYGLVAEMRRRLAWNIGWRERYLNLSLATETLPPRLDYRGFHTIWDFKMQQDTTDYLHIEKYKPTAIFGSPSLIKILAHTVQRRESSKICPKAIISGYELLDKGTRQYFSEVFDTEIFDRYGCTEAAGWIAWECPEHAGHHIDTDNVIMEFINNGEPVTKGERGEIIITTLHNYAMPLIRYEVGDIGTFTDELCPCGRKLPLIKIICGRTGDFIVLPNEKVLSPHELTYQMLHPAISKYQIIQENKNLVVIRFIEGLGFTSKIREDIENNCRKILGDDVEIRLVSVDTLPQEKSGKFQTLISKVHSSYLT